MSKSSNWRNVLVKKKTRKKNRLQSIFLSVGTFFMMFTLPGCFFNQTRSVKVAKASAQIHEYQARFTDMPFPFDANVQNKNLVTDYGDKVQFFIVFSTKMSLSDLQSLYHQEMEQLGWQERTLFEHDPQQFILVFEKPTKLCVITLQPHARTCTVKYHITTTF